MQKRERIVGTDTYDVVKCIYGVFSRENHIVTPMWFTPAHICFSVRAEKNWA